MEEYLIPTGLVVILVGIFLVILGSVLASGGEVKYAVGGFIGPVPIGFANDPRLLVLIIAVSLMFFIFFLVRSFF